MQLLSASALAARVTVALSCKYVQLVCFFPVGTYVPTCAHAAVTVIIPLQQAGHLAVDSILSSQKERRNITSHQTQTQPRQ